MKYVTPTVEITVVESDDVITTSQPKHEIEKNNDGSGNVIFDALNLFA